MITQPMMQVVVPFICILLSLSEVFTSVDVRQENQAAWNAFKLKYNLSFVGNTDAHRKSIFLKNRGIIEALNSRYVDTKFAINKFAHLTNDEFLELTANPRLKYVPLHQVIGPFNSVKNFRLPDVNWIKKKRVTAVKDQKACSCCYIFSAVAVLEGYYAKKQHSLVEFSEQRILERLESGLADGCYGGLPDAVYNHVKENGLYKMSEYPYLGEDRPGGDSNSGNVAFSFKGVVHIPPGDEGALSEAVAYKGPVSVSIDASGPEFQFYKSGVFSNPQCHPTRLTRSMVVVGLGTFPRKHYIVKNSFGTDWGDRGYIMIPRYAGNMCGIASYASYIAI